MPKPTGKPTATATAAAAPTPAPAKSKHGWERAFEILGILLGAVGVKELLRDTVQKGVGQAIAPFVAPLKEDQRASLLEDLRKMPPADTINLWRRIREAQTLNREPRLVYLLSKIEKNEQDPSIGRQATLKWLNDQSDPEFDAALDVLNHDVVISWVKRVQTHTGPVAQTEIDHLRDAVVKIASKTRDTIRQATRKVDIFATSEAAPLVDKLTKWIQNRR